MITIPSVLNHKNVVVFPDDEDCNLFYALKTSPEIRVENGQPIFSGLFWTDRADGSSDSVAGLAGGWINFDAHLGVSQAVLDEIAGKLKSAQVQEDRRRILIKKERERLGLIAKARGETTIPDPDVPPVREIRFGAVSFTEGTVTLLEEKAGDLIPWSSAGGPASLIGDNNAAFALRLSPTGAAIWYKALKDGIKAISIRYDLKFQMRLPSLEIRAWAGSTQESEINRKVDRVWRNTDQGCSDADVERINVSEVTEKLVEEGLMNIEVRKGSSEISDEYVSQLRNMAMKLIEEKVREIIKSRIHGMTEDERKNSMIKVMKEEVRSFVELRFTQEDVVEWQIAPQGTIMNFLEGISESRKQHITKLVDLSVQEVETITLRTSVDAPWDEAPFVNAVKVNVEYPAAGQRNSVLFQKGTAPDVWHFRRPKKDDGVAKYTTEVFFRGISQPVVLPPESTNSETINVNIGKLGLIDAVFKPHPILSSLTGANAVTAVQVDVSYKEEGEPGHFTDTLLLKLDKPEGERLTRILGRVIDAPLVYRATYFFSGGNTLQMEEKKYYVTESNLVSILIASPYQDTMDLTIELPQPPDKSVKKVIVEVRYEDAANQFSSVGKAELSADDDWDPALIKIVMVDKKQSKFKYQYRIVSDDSIARSALIDGDGEGTLILPIFKVNINAGQLKLGSVYSNALLTLQYTNGTAKSSREIFLDPASATGVISWYIPRTSETDTSYSYQLALIKEDGSSVETSGTSQGSFLILKAPAVS
ncbi:hypothetical protein [Larkinella soli]|uniref:hypothetical protein n=1 Tax=Larkinella soli TaxID=1770527 RepID=UPI000FFB786F|nr:hypothetical protein [Larkinella soli]